VNISPLLDLSHTGGATPADPSIFSYAYEFTEAEANALNLPDLSVTQSLTCYMSPQTITSVSQNDDLTTLSTLVEVTSVIGDPGSGSTPADQNSNTSNANELIGKKTVIALVAWLGLVALY